MGRDIVIHGPHGPIDAWRAEPPDHAAALGGVLVLQEIFGVNEHIRSVAEGYAAAGYVALAPALFDPVARNVELGYDEAGFARGRALVDALGMDRAVGVVRAAADALRDEGLRVAAIGFCWGGSVAFLANARLGIPAVAYYGARTEPFLGEPLRAPMLFHFGGDDASTPPAYIQAHRDACPDADIHVYPGAGHAFNRDVDPRHFHATSAALARKRTLAFLDAALR
ncbi:dienelactone hydrolase family protein [Luteimonas viscosa]|uniref:Dienelactone hydrolase family protein n=1 Tax=Luteimonas viscosa TaxID=1132694 RepID=A0A5D4XKC6_9GAMM|nr:dienelactone hydrolase family protein [Luteimonas viscosa]TYT25147.1 dienelactone hydrolase family protein [Luteimonas viscosa]